jgi:hypothetical protein
MKNENEIVVCPECGVKYYKKEGCLFCKDAQQRPSTTATKSKGLMDIPQGNINTYLYWYNLLRKIQSTEFSELDFHEPLNVLKELQKRWSLSDDWLWTAYKPINIGQCEETDLFNPFRRVWHFMTRGKEIGRSSYKEWWPNSPNVSKKGFFIARDYSKKRQGGGGKNRINWALNVLLCGLVEDCQWYGKGEKLAEAQIIFDKLSISEANTFTYNSFQKHYRDIDKADINNLLEALHKACTEANLPFVPSGVSISEWPTDFLANVADHTKYKINPYLSGEKHLTDQMKESLPKHLKKLIRK